jgi:iron complex transport system substrate-binding protein
LQVFSSLKSFFFHACRSGVKFFSAIAASYCVLASLAAASPIGVSDDRGRTLTLEAPARRIVALAPSITELAYAAGAGAKLVGVSEYSDYPQQAKNIIRVGDATHADIERIAMLKPDLILAWKSGNHAGDISKLEKLGFKVFVMEPEKLTDIPRLLRSIGKLAETSATAGAAAGDFERKMESLMARYSRKRPVKVFYEIWHEPLMTVNGAHMTSDVLRLCGSDNAFATARMLTPVISPEGLVAADPEVIISGYSKPENWQRFKMLSAVRNHRVFFVQPELLERQSPRILEGASEVCKRVEQVRQADN